MTNLSKHAILSIVLEKLESRKTSALEKLWREAHGNTGSKANRKNHRAETADSWATAERSKRECMAPVLGILPEHAEQNKDFEVGDMAGHLSAGV